MKKCIECTRIFKREKVHTGVLLRKKCVQRGPFFSLVKKNSSPPLIYDNKQGPLGGTYRKIDNIFFERKDEILLSF